MVRFFFSTIFAIAALTFAAPCKVQAGAGPSITTQPQSQSVVADSNAVFTVVAGGQTPLFYQWSLNGTNLANSAHISGATNATLTVSNVVTGDGGNYLVVVTNTYGNSTSAVATLTVQNPVFIIGQPSSEAVLFGSNASFTVSATGTALNYQWYFNGTPLSDGGRISGSAAPTLSIANVQSNDAGAYYVTVTNFFSAAKSMTASLTPLAIPGPSVRYVSLNSTNPMSPYLDWGTAATNIQDAVDAAVDGDFVVVSNGVYATGGRPVYGTLTNCVAVTKRVLVQSVNGPAMTVIQGNGPNGSNAVRCVYLTNGATLDGFTLTNGATLASGDVFREQSGGGVWCETNNAVLTNCWLLRNSSYNSGGGAYNGVLNNCILVGNSSLNAGGAASATLNNCTLAANSADSSGGASYCVLNKCNLIGNSAAFSAGGATGGTLNGCILTSNSAASAGGGVWEGTLNNCILTGNSAFQGGGTYYSTLSNCTLTGNYADSGAGAFHGTLTNCVLTENSASYEGGGVDSSTLVNCTLNGNSASSYGGGAYAATLRNCALSGNFAGYGGGGTYSGVLTNCTLTGNAAVVSGGGLSGGTANNCIVYYNLSQTGANYDYGTLSYCCTTPLAPGAGNIASDPQMASLSHLSTVSPCREAGNPAFASGVDIDGESWANPPSIGCDEYHAGAVTGPLNVAVVASYTNVAVGFEANFTAQIGGRLDASRWDFGDGTIVSNHPSASHAWSAAGNYAVTLTAYNETYPDGVSASIMVQVVQPVHYVALGSTNPVPPYSSWSTAASNIQDAVDAASVPGALILVSNGVYQTGGRTANGYLLTNRVVIDKPVTVRSVNGPIATVIQGDGNGMRCAYLTNSAMLSGFTLTGGATLWAGVENHDQSGGAVWCEWLGAVVTNCMLTSNFARYYGGGAYGAILDNCQLSSNSATYGGGAMLGRLNNCALVNNSANFGGGAESATLNNCLLSTNYGGYSGGGAETATLNNCTLVGNTAYTIGGGADSSTLNNCIVYYNTAGGGSNYWSCTLNNCCTMPLPTNGLNNIASEPLFVDLPAGNFRLQTNSPCINAGNNANAVGPTDLDGRPRIVAGTVDIGAYEFQGPGMGEFLGWLQQYGLPTDGSADYADTDGTGMNNWQKWIAGLNPTNPASMLAMLSPVVATNSGIVTISWMSVGNRTYYLQRGTNLAAQPAFSSIRSNILGQASTTTFMDTTATNGGPYFYRVGVQY